MTTQTPDAVREAVYCLCCCRLEADHIRGQCPVTSYFIPNVPAALDSRAGDAGEGLSDDAPTPADALAMIEQEISFWPEGSRAQAAATRCRNIVRAMVRALSATPAPAVDAQNDAPLVAALCEIRRLAVPAGNVWTGDEPEWQATIARIAHDAVEAHDAAVDAVPAGEVKGFSVEGGANSHVFDLRIMRGEECVAFADEEWAHRIAAALSHGETGQ